MNRSVMASPHMTARVRDVSMTEGVKCGGFAALEKRIGNLCLIGIPFVGSLFYPVFAYRHGIRLIEVSAFFVGLMIIGIGIGIGFHRYLAHGGFEANWLTRTVFAVLGSMAFQGSAIRWVADHRRHHRYADREGDPHSPYVTTAGRRMAKFRGFFHAHLTWLFDPYTTDYNVYAPDLLQDRLIVWLTRSYWFWPALFLALAYAYGYLLGDSRAGVASVLLGGCLATTVSHNLTWGLNSIAHYYGRQTYPRKDESRNNWIMGWLTMGEGWHNNHHAFPRTPFLGHGPDEVDWNGAVIRLLERLGVIRHVVRMGDRRR